MLYKFCLNETLFVQSLFIFQNFYSAVLFFFMVIAFKNNSKTSFSTLLLYLISVAKMLIHSYDILVLIIVKAMVCIVVENTVVWLSSTWLGMHAQVFLLLSFLNWEEINVLIFKYFSFFNIPHERSKHFKSFVGTHWKSCVIVARSSTILLMPQGW